MAEGDIEKKLEGIIQNSSLIVDSTNFEEELKKITTHKILKKDKYIINYDIIVNSTGILEIEPGTKIYFGPEGGIFSYGELRAKGTEQERIKFSKAEQSWKNIKIKGGLASDTILEYCTINGGTGRPDMCYAVDKENIFVGGGMIISDANPTIKNTIIEGNKAQKGGGICFFESNAIIDNCTIRNNKAQDGGGIYAYRDAAPIIQNSIITNNIASRSGGGIETEENSHPQIINNKINQNTASLFGGGIDIGKNSNPEVTSNEIMYNQAENGAGILLMGKNQIIGINNNNIQYNKAGRNSAGTPQAGGINSESYSDSNTIKNNTPIDTENG